MSPTFDYEQAKKQLEQFAVQIPEAVLQAGVPAMEQALLALYRSIPEYPEAPAKSRYVRTETLGRRWTTQLERKGNVIIGEIGTNVDYAPWVVGPDFPGEDFGGKTMYQARVHVDRWWQFLPTMDANEPEAWEEFSDTFWPELERLFEES